MADLYVTRVCIYFANPLKLIHLLKIFCEYRNIWSFDKCNTEQRYFHIWDAEIN